jgi:hypothetical protein
MNAPHSKYFASGKFGRLFPTLPPLFHRDKSEEDLRGALVDLGATGGPMDPTGQADPDNPDVPAGFGFLGQFIDHDITFDTTSSFERQNDPEGIENFRTPALELDSVYGSGPEVTPYFYAPDGVRLLVEQEHGRDQLPRNTIGTAVIGDPRNDENLIISQLQLAFLKFHNAVVDAIEPVCEPEHLFEEAQRIVRWHYQWIVLHEYLPLTVGQDLVDDIYDVCGGGGRQFFNWRHKPFIPVEFAVAAYRFGHTQIPGALKVNDDFTSNGSDEIPLFDRNEVGDSDPDDLQSFGLRAPRRYVDWKYLFETSNTNPQPSKQIDSVLAPPLFDLPFVPPGSRASLAVRNLERGHAFGLPSGQAVACAMCIDPLSPSDLSDVASLGFDKVTPLWFYILKEAEVVESGKRLGPVGGRIVAEVLIGLLEGDRQSFVRADPKWTPANEGIGTDADFKIADLLKFADVA